MTTYETNLSTRNTLLQIAFARWEASRQRSGPQPGDDTELREREQAAIDLLEEGKSAATEWETARAEMIQQHENVVAAQQKEIRDLQEELRVVSVEKGELNDLIDKLNGQIDQLKAETEIQATRFEAAMAENTRVRAEVWDLRSGEIKRLETELKALRAEKAMRER